MDLGRLKLNRKKQRQGIQGLRSIYDRNDNDNLKPIFAGAAVSCLFAIFYDNENKDYFRIKNIPDIEDAIQILETLGLKISDSVSSIKVTSRNSLAKSDKRKWNTIK
jgi:hypothetical protein